MVKITSIKAYPVNINYKPAWQHDKRFYIKTAVQTNVIIIVETDVGIKGLGEAAHSPGVFGETADGTMGAIKLFDSHLLGENPSNIIKINFIMDRLSPIGNVAAKAGIDIAIHDAKAKFLNVPVYQILGGLTHSKLKTHINPATTDHIVGDTKSFINEGYRVFKVKMSGDLDYDVKMVEKILHEVDHTILLSLDANQGWGVTESINVANRIADHKNYQNNVILEQPVLASDVKGMARIRNSSPLPLMADDGLRTPKDLQIVLEEEAADIVSLKISRSGGFLKTQEMVFMAETANIPYIVDEINEMKVANTAVAHLALASAKPLYTGVCCHLLLEKDVVKKGGVIVENGYAKLSDAPGLGIEEIDLSLCKKSV